MSDRPADLRRNYDRDVLLEEQAHADPVIQFDRWFKDALGGEIYEPNAVALATVAADGQPSLRMVLLKGFDADGFVFYTNLESRKALELAANGQAALLFWWDRLHRQVRIEGATSGVDAAEADAYFASRPHGSRIGAVASPQSRGDRRPAAARGSGGGHCCPASGGRAATAALGWLPRPPDAVRVLAGSAQPAA